MNDILTEHTLPELSPEGQAALRDLLAIWFDFERRLDRVPIIQRLQRGTFTRQDYQNLLLHLRQQVIEGSRWIARTSSGFDRNHADVRSIVIGHAQEEHRDYEVLEQDYVASGGDLKTIQTQPKNPGSEALHGYLMHQASQPNPFGMLGAMWIIEGLGQKMAQDWATKIHDCIEGSSEFTRFITYHGENDDDHMTKLYGLLDRIAQDESWLERVKQTARTVGRLYALQLTEIDEVSP